MVLREVFRLLMGFHWFSESGFCDWFLLVLARRVLVISLVLSLSLSLSLSGAGVCDRTTSCTCDDTPSWNAPGPALRTPIPSAPAKPPLLLLPEARGAAASLPPPLSLLPLPSPERSPARRTSCWFLHGRGGSPGEKAPGTPNLKQSFMTRAGPNVCL